MTKEQPRANCSGHSWQNSDCEQFAQVTLFYEWPEPMAQKLAICSKKIGKIVFFLCFLQFFPFLCQRANPPIALRSVTHLLKSNHEQIAQVTLYKIATVSHSLRLLMTNERWEQFALFHERIALSFTKIEESLEKPNRCYHCRTGWANFWQLFPIFDIQHRAQNFPRSKKVSSPNPPFMLVQKGPMFVICSKIYILEYFNT